MPLTFGQARELLAVYAGRGGLCPDDDQVSLFVREVLQYILFKGPTAAIRTYCFQSCGGCITIPYELEVPLKVKINNESGSVWSEWFKFYDSGFMDGECLPASNAMVEEANKFATIYDVPEGGSKIGVVGICEEDKDAHIVVKGVDATGREIITNHKGEQISGEYLSIKKGQVQLSSVKFARIDSVVKTRTNGYVQLLAIGDNWNNRKFLADYSPFEEIPQYRRFKLTVRCSNRAIVNVLGRIRLKDHYADNDVIPIENLHLLKIAAQGIQLESNNDVQSAQIKDKMVDTLLDQENRYKKVSVGQPLDVYHPISGGSIQNIVQGLNFRKWWGGGRG